MDFKDLRSWLLDTHIPSVQEFLDLFQEGIVIINRQGIVTYLNDSYCDFLNVPKREAIGKAIQKVIPSTGFPEVMKSGKPQYKQYHVYDDNREVIANRIPIYIDGKIEGMVGEVLLKSRSELDKVSKNFAILNERIKHTERQIDKHIHTSVYTFDDIVAKDASIIRIKTVAAKAARSLSPVLLEGESGTGKELFAHSIHSAGNRSHGPFIRLNCAAIPADLLEAELFGYEKGAFTGALSSGKPGKFELADKGIIFLDEIGDMPLNMQSKLLRVLEEGQITRLGDTKPRKIDFVCIAATNRNLESMIEQNLFRLDLFFRLSVVRLRLPPLRELPKTLMAHCDRMLKEKALSAGLSTKRFSSDALKLLKKYNWPGNVRELSNVIESAVNMSEGEAISASELPRRLLAKTVAADMKSKSPTTDLYSYLQTAEAEYIKDSLKEMNYNVSATAKKLGIHRTWLYQKIKKYNISIR